MIGKETFTKKYKMKNNFKICYKNQKNQAIKIKDGIVFCSIDDNKTYSMVFIQKFGNKQNLH